MRKTSVRIRPFNVGGAFEIVLPNGKVILLDPFFTGNMVDYLAQQPVSLLFILSQKHVFGNGFSENSQKTNRKFYVFFVW